MTLLSPTECETSRLKSSPCTIHHSTPSKDGTKCKWLSFLGGNTSTVYNENQVNYSLRSKMIVGLPLRNLLQDGRGFRCNIMNYRPLHILPRINNPTIILERREYLFIITRAGYEFTKTRRKLVGYFSLCYSTISIS